MIRDNLSKVPKPSKTQSEMATYIKRLESMIDYLKKENAELKKQLKEKDE